LQSIKAIGQPLLGQGPRQLGIIGAQFDRVQQGQGPLGVVVLQFAIGSMNIIIFHNLPATDACYGAA
jgi:hypothetical protein